MKTKLWVLTPEEAEKFFEMSIMKEAVTQEEKIKILNDMNLPTSEFNGSPEKLVDEMSKYTNVYHVKKKGGSR